MATGAALSQAGCFYSDQGLSPPHQSFYFPAGLAVSPGRNALYVANSDFDLQFNGGTVQILDLSKMRGTLDAMLTRIRCVEGAPDACKELTAPPASLHEACNGVTYRDATSGRGNGQPCSQAVECASGVCLNGTDLLPGACDKCAANADCNAGGRCLAGVCALEENFNQILTPSACTPVAPPFAAGQPLFDVKGKPVLDVKGKPVLGKPFATIGAFASGAVLAQAPAPLTGVRLFVPVRGDPSITWFEVVDERAPLVTNNNVAELACGGVGDDNRCFQDNQIGLDPYENVRSLKLPVEPNGIDVSEDGTIIVSAHQIQNGPAVGLTTNVWGQRPSFQFYLGSNVGAGPTEVAHVPVPAIVKRFPSIAYQPGFLVTYNATPEVDLFRYNDDALGRPPRPFLTRASQGNVSVNADGKDSRGLVVDPSKRQACEKGCDALTSSGPACQAKPDARSCLRCCLETPLDLFVANRAPPSLLLGHVRTQIVDSNQGGPVGSGAFDFVEIYDTVSLAQGPSKVGLGNIIGGDGKLHRRVFTVTFDTKHIFSYDPELRTVDTVIETGPGPHALAFDTCTDDCAPGETPHSYLYVGHFTDSYLGVVDLDARHRETFGIMFASIGTPMGPRESK